MQYVGPGEVHALPLGVAAERSVHYFWDYWSEWLVALSQIKVSTINGVFCQAQPKLQVQLEAE